jgi:hypothetical protein
MKYSSLSLQYYLERNLEARERELARAEELEEKAPKVKAKSKMSKVKCLICIFASELHCIRHIVTMA